jgi:hypothetical protein
MTDDVRKILLAIARRKADDACDPCRGTGLLNAKVCTECLGQGVPLFEDEHNALQRLSAGSTDYILNAEILNENSDSAVP